MNKNQYYLMKLAEEAAELAQVALKCAAFGMDEVHPNTLEKNYEALIKEWNDVNACAILVETMDNRFEWDCNSDLLDMKFHKIEKYRKISVGNGMSTNDEV
jgi:hypothetical protein